MTTRIASIWRASGSTALGIFGALIFFTNVGTAQELSALSNLIFEPVRLSAAIDSPIELGGPSESDRQALSNAISQHLAVTEPLRNSGSSDPKLIERLGQLAVAYQILNRHQEALETLEEAIGLTVENGGRRNLEQIPLQEQKIPSYLALDDIRGVDSTEEFIYSLHLRSLEPGDRQMYIATMNLADWNTAAYYRENYAAGSRALKRQGAVVARTQRCISLPGAVAAPGSVEDEDGCQAIPIFDGTIKNVSKQDIIDDRLRKIDRLYASYQRAVSNTGNAQLDVVVDIAKRVAQLAFATKQEMDFERDNSIYDPNYDGSREQAARNSPARMNESYESGEDALNYSITVLRSVEGVRPEVLAAALLDLGDWHLAYGKTAAAEKAYGEARQVLLDAGFSSANIDLALATEMPVQIPVFATHLYSRRSTGVGPNAELDFRGYVDLSYSIDSLGNASNVQILGRSAEDTARIETLIARQLKSMKFRPVLRGGQLVGLGPIEARYYYSY
jgi:tetratricopeptide (TPR) repeat protein